MTWFCQGIYLGGSSISRAGGGVCLQQVCCHLLVTYSAVCGQSGRNYCNAIKYLYAAKFFFFIRAQQALKVDDVTWLLKAHQNLSTNIRTYFVDKTFSILCVSLYELGLLQFESQHNQNSPAISIFRSAVSVLQHQWYRLFPHSQRRVRQLP